MACMWAIKEEAALHIVYWSCMVAMLMSVPLRVIGQTRIGYYDRSCPAAESIVKSTVRAHTRADISVPGGLLRLHFHDCFVRGCDGSVLIDGPNAERTARANYGLRGFEVIEDAKARIEAICPGIVSCADILALAAQSAVELSKGPSWRVPLGRLDGTISSASDVSNMPSPTDSIFMIKEKFAARGLSDEDLVTLNVKAGGDFTHIYSNFYLHQRKSGAHTLGQTDCGFFSYRLYNYEQTGTVDPTMNTQAVAALKSLCPANGDGSNQVALDKGSPSTFDTSFFKNVFDGFAVLESDQKLMSDDDTAIYVRRYAGVKSGGVVGVIGGIIGGILGGGSSSFNSAFARSMVKMSNIDVVSEEDEGEIRQVCSRFN